MKRPLRSTFLPLTIGFIAGISVVLVFFFLRDDLRSWRLDPYQGRLWEIILKALAGLLALSGAIVAVLKYLDDKAAAARASEKETIKDLLAMRQDIYVRLIKTMAKLINRDPNDARDSDWLPLQDMFFEIYWGELRWVWNEEVETAARKYADALWEYKGGSKHDLIALTEEVVRACRKSLGEAWDIKKDLIPSQPLKSTKDELTDRKARHDLGGGTAFG